MKTIFLSTILIIPSIWVLNESENIITNIIGLIYIVVLILLAKKNQRVKQLFIDTETELNYLTDKILKQDEDTRRG